MPQTLETTHSETADAIAAHFRAHRWQEAAAALQAIPRRDSSAEFRLRLARNLAAFARFRPEIYPVLVEALPSSEDGFEIVHGKLRRWTIAGSEYLCRDGDPVSTTMQSLTEMKSVWKSGRPLALCGLGDGYLLAAVAGFSPALLLGREQAVYLIEPRPDLLLTILLLHDFSGPDGPIQQPRFHWCVGKNWPDQFRNIFLSDLYCSFPEHRTCQGHDFAEYNSVFSNVLDELSQLDKQLAQRVRALYENVTASQLAEVFAPNPPRPPRVLLVTSRFTTVIQYSTAQAAEAFGNLGWQTRTIIEPSNHQALRKTAMRQALADFHPDLVILIDHLRHEYDDVFPPNLPFACWIQDHLPNLCNPSAGAAVKSRDFVLTAIGTHFVNQYGYPLRQIVDLPNLARVPKRPVAWRSDGLDLVYISNWSKTTNSVIQGISAHSASSPELRIISDAAVSRMIFLYDHGHSLATQRDVREVVQRAQLDCGVRIADPALLDGFINLLWDRLNNHLYRHQSLLWIADLAQRKNLSFGLFGRGWQDHPQLHRFDQGVVTPGEDLENLVRKTKINLQLEPFACFTHPRLLSGLFAGGFFLIRDHPFNHLPQRLLDFVCENFSDDIETTRQARAAVTSQNMDALESILRQCQSMSEQADPIQMARNWQRAGLIRPGQPPVSHLTDVIFSDPASLERNTLRFLADEPLRGAVGQALRQDLESRLSYEAGLTRACQRIGNLLRTET